MKIALLFPGQGAQYSGMGKSFYDQFPETRPIFEQADAALGFSLTQTIFSGTEEDLKQTKITQPAIFTVSCAAYTVFAEHCPTLLAQSAMVAGHSLGEYSALVAAGAFDFGTGIQLVRARGNSIQKCCDASAGAMAAVLGVEREMLKSLCKETKQGDDFCECVNFNCPGQIVVAGTKSAVDNLTRKTLGIAGAKVIALAVSGAFHSKLMRPAALEMKAVLAAHTVHDCRVPVLTNFDAAETVTAADVREKLYLQIDHPVLWEDSIQRMIVSGIDTFIELGPGRVLSGLMRKIDRKKTVFNIEDADSLAKIKQGLSL